MGQKVQKLRLHVENGALARFLALFQQGFFLSAPVGASLEEVLTMAGFSREYLQTRVQTVFHNGHAVDDAVTETVGGGSTVALSAAMPGLVGAIFRKKSPIAALRSQTGKGVECVSGRGRTELIRVKLFNSVAQDMGPALLAQGILLDGAVAADFFASRRELLKPVIAHAHLDGEIIDPERLFRSSCALSERLFLVVE